MGLRTTINAVAASAVAKLTDPTGTWQYALRTSGPAAEPALYAGGWVTPSYGVSTQKQWAKEYVENLKAYKMVGRCQLRVPAAVVLHDGDMVRSSATDVWAVESLAREEAGTRLYHLRTDRPLDAGENRQGGSA